MTPTLAKPWLGLYGEHPATMRPIHENALAMFSATLERSPDAPLMHYFDQSITAREVADASDSLAVALISSGVKPGDRVAMYLQNVPQVMVVLLAAWKAGAVVVPCNPMLRDRELSKILVDSGSRVLVCLDDLYEQVAANALAATAVEATIITSAGDMYTGADKPAVINITTGPLHGVQRLSEILEKHKGAVPPDIDLVADDVALMVYTSGTTGAPKGATNTHRNVVFATTVYQQWLKLTERDAILGLAPLFHVTGLVGHVTLSMLTGAPLVLFYKFDADQACRLAERYRATFTVSAVTAFIALLNSDAIKKYDLSALTKVYTGGAPTPVATLEEWFARTGTRIHPMYGLTEATSPTHMTPFGSQPPVDPATGVVSVGVPVFDTDVRVLADNGDPAGVHQIGELHIAGPQIVPGYWQKPAETAEALNRGYLRTGDVGFMDEAGWFYLVDRAKDMIVASGFKVWPREVEEVLYLHPAVLEAAVVGVPDPYRGENVKAYVSLKAGFHATADEIKAFARERMAAYKYPRIVEITDEIPKNASGKVLRRVMQEHAVASETAAADLRYHDLRAAVEARAVLELGIVESVLSGTQLRAGRAVGLYRRLETMLAQVRPDGSYVDRTAFLGANQDYHQYLIDLADNEPLSLAFAHLGLKGLFIEALQHSDATSEQAIVQHEMLTDSIAAGNVHGAQHAILSWTEASKGRLRIAMGVTADASAHKRDGDAVRIGGDGLSSSAAMQSAGSPTLDRGALAEAIDARAALEIGVLRLVGVQLGDADRELLAARLLVRTPLVRGDDATHVQRYVDADDAYHRAFMQIVDNQPVERMYAGLGIPQLMEATIAGVLPEVRAVMDDHNELIDALRSGNIDAACRAIASQNQQVHAILIGGSMRVSASPVLTG